jgi:hypothetical protein
MSVERASTVCDACGQIGEHSSLCIVEALALERDRFREALSLIAQHARLDLTERGITEAERYAAIAEDALR